MRSDRPRLRLVLQTGAMPPEIRCDRMRFAAALRTRGTRNRSPTVAFSRPRLGRGPRNDRQRQGERDRDLRGLGSLLIAFLRRLSWVSNSAFAIATESQSTTTFSNESKVYWFLMRRKASPSSARNRARSSTGPAKRCPLQHYSNRIACRIGTG